MREKYLGIIETEEDIFYLTRDDNYIYNNGVANAGSYHLDEYPIDEYLNFDDNLTNFVEILEGKKW